MKRTSARTWVTLIILAILAALAVFGQLSPPEASAPSGPAAQPNQPNQPNQPDDGSRHLALGNPSGASANPAAPENFLISREEYALAYSRALGIPRWVAWNLNSADFGPVDRYGGQFISDESLPARWYRVAHNDYTGSGYDRGHLVPSADRTASEAAQIATFYLTNIVPQAPANNRGVWASLEEESRRFVRQEGSELYIVAGPIGRATTLAGGQVTVPEALFKVAMILPEGSNDLSRVNATSQSFAVIIPNRDDVSDNWRDYRTSIDCVERATGLDFFSNLPDDIEAELEARGGDCAEDGSAPAPFASAVDCGFDPGAGSAPESPVAILFVDDQAEVVTLRNMSDQPVELDGWRMCSIRGPQEHLGIGGTLAPGEERDFPADGGSIWSNSDLDPGALYDTEGNLISYWADE